MTELAVNPDWERYARDLFASEGYMRHLGAELVSVAPGASELSAAYRPELSQHHGFFHGGVIGGILDDAGGVAAATLAPVGASVLTVEYKVNFVRAAAGIALVARGKVLRRGQLTTCESQAFTVDKSGTETLVATALQTIAIKIVA